MNPARPVPTAGLVYWQDVYWRLMQGRMRLRPWEIERLTIPEMVLALDDDVERERPPIGLTPMSPEEIREHVRRLRAMTPRQRLEAAREGRL